MNLSYILLGLTVSISLFMKNRNFVVLAIVITTISAFVQGIVNIVGISMILFFFVVCQVYFSKDALNKHLKNLLYIVIIILVGCAISHVIPGFSNALVIEKLRVSELSSPFSMYLNFDKIIIALILYVTGKLFLLEKFIDKKSIQQTLFCLLLCVVVILIPGLLLGYIQFDPKVPDILWLWMFNNLLFVAIGEEIIFRGFVQNSLKSFLGKKAENNYLHIIIASIVFGLLHFKGGIVYVLLASIAGGFYGYTYDKTNRIFCAAIVHFGLNLVHLLIFTYPSSILVHR
jgi:membrane protease YdiL (CAAX protease family)